jgi:hypothetical protein
MADAERVNQIGVEFERLRAERLSRAKEFIATSDSFEGLLADVANLAMLIFVGIEYRKLPPGFKSTMDK